MAREILTADLGGEALSPDELAAIPEFASIRKEIWAKFPGAIARKTYQPGETIVREGEFGTTAFYILSGQADVFLESKIAAVEARLREHRRWFESPTKVNRRTKSNVRLERSMGSPDRTHIPIDASVDLPIDNPMAVLGPGEIFGELCALAAFKQEKVKRPKFYPRSATVEARTQVVALEMLPNILNNVIYNAPAFKEKLNDNYRLRALDNHLRSVPVFNNLSQEFLDYLRKKVELVYCSPGQVICRQGEVPDAFYLIRLGFVKVSREFAGGEMVLSYLSRGSYFGEIGLLPPAYRLIARGPRGNEMNAMITHKPVTVGHSPSSIPQVPIPWDEQLSREHFQMMVEGHQVRVNRLPGSNPITYRGQSFDTLLMQPGESFVAGETRFEVQTEAMGTGRRTATCTAIDFVQLVKIASDDFAKMMEANPNVEWAISEVAHARGEMDRQMLRRVQKVSLDDFLQQELMQGQNLLLIDLDKCTRCDECVKACAATHEDGVTRLIRDGLRFDHYLVPTSCRACMDPLCMTRCPVGSIRRKDSLDIVIEDWCIGCGNCALDCPYGNINVVDLANGAGHKAEAPQPKATVCDLCAEYEEPNCVRACPHDAAIRVEPKKFFAQELAGVQLSEHIAAAALRESPVREIRLAPAPAPKQSAYVLDGEVLTSPLLKVLAGPNAGSTLQLRHPSTTFGRSGRVTYSFPDIRDLSRLHFSIIAEGGKLVIEDNDSTNGTFVNGNLVESLELHLGDVVQAGPVQMEVVATAS